MPPAFPALGDASATRSWRIICATRRRNEYAIQRQIFTFSTWPGLASAASSVVQPLLHSSWSWPMHSHTSADSHTGPTGPPTCCGLTASPPGAGHVRFATAIFCRAGLLSQLPVHDLDCLTILGVSDQFSGSWRLCCSLLAVWRAQPREHSPRRFLLSSGESCTEISIDLAITSALTRQQLGTEQNFYILYSTLWPTICENIILIALKLRPG